MVYLWIIYIVLYYCIGLCCFCCIICFKAVKFLFHVCIVQVFYFGSCVNTVYLIIFIVKQFWQCIVVCTKFCSPNSVKTFIEYLHACYCEYSYPQGFYNGPEIDECFFLLKLLTKFQLCSSNTGIPIFSSSSFILLFFFN